VLLRFREPKNLLTSFLHMHGVGKSMIVRRYREGRELSPIADLRAFDYPFQVTADCQGLVLMREVASPYINT
jgi:hypothetical protein